MDSFPFQIFPHSQKKNGKSFAHPAIFPSNWLTDFNWNRNRFCVMKMVNLFSFRLFSSACLLNEPRSGNSSSFEPSNFDSVAELAIPLCDIKFSKFSISPAQNLAILCGLQLSTQLTKYIQFPSSHGWLNDAQFQIWGTRTHQPKCHKKILNFKFVAISTFS